MKDKIALIIVIFIVLISIYKESQMLGCNNNLFKILTFDTNCKVENNHIIKYLHEHKPIDPLLSFDRVVFWRRSFIIAFSVYLIYYLIYDFKFDSVKMLIVLLSSTFVIYFSLNFYQFHLNYYIENEIRKMYEIKLKI